MPTVGERAAILQRMKMGRGAGAAMEKMLCQGSCTVSMLICGLVSYTPWWQNLPVGCRSLWHGREVCSPRSGRGGQQR